MMVFFGLVAHCINSSREYPHSRSGKLASTTWNVQQFNYIVYNWPHDSGVGLWRLREMFVSLFGSGDSQLWGLWFCVCGKYQKWSASITTMQAVQLYIINTYSTLGDGRRLRSVRLWQNFRCLKLKGFVRSVSNALVNFSLIHSICWCRKHF